MYNKSHKSSLHLYCGLQGALLNNKMTQNKYLVKTVKINLLSNTDKNHFASILILEVVRRYLVRFEAVLCNALR